MKTAGLYVIIDHTILPADTDLSALADALVGGGADIIQYRDKDNPDNIFLANARKISAAIDKKIPFIINDRLHLTKDAGAEGIHLGQNDENPLKAREILGSEAIIGVTANTFEQAENGWKSGTDYIGMGAVFSTDTKKNARPLGLDTFIKTSELSPVPVFAIGGINEDNIDTLLEKKIKKICLSSAIIKEPQNAYAKTRWFKDKICQDEK